MKLPMEITESMLSLYRRYEETSMKKIAVFDLDQTLIDGDIGEAVYAQLAADGVPLPLEPDLYQLLLEIDRHRAYEEVVRAMEYVSVETVIEATRNVMRSTASHLEFGTKNIPVPRPNMLMKELVRLLRFLDFTTYVISASNDISVKMIASEWFGIPAANAMGIKSVIHNNRLTSSLYEPVPAGEGKVALYHQVSPHIHPAVVVTDSEMDLPLLQMCEPYGMVFLVGENDALLRAAKETLPCTIQLFSMPAGTIVPETSRQQSMV